MPIKGVPFERSPNKKEHPMKIDITGTDFEMVLTAVRNMVAEWDRDRAEHGSLADRQHATWAALLERLESVDE